MFGAGLVATMAALVLGLLITSTKGTHDQVDAKVNTTASTFIHLDRMLADYGPETADIRKLLRESLQYRIQRIWPEGHPNSSPIDLAARSRAEDLSDKITMLKPADERQKYYQEEALNLANDLLQLRWEIEATSCIKIPILLYIIPILWISFLTFAYALYSPYNPTVILMLLFCCLCVASAIFLIYEMSDPLEGHIKVSSLPLQMIMDKMGD